MSSISARRRSFSAWREAKFPFFAANLRGSDGAPLPGFKDRAIVTFDGVRDRPHRRDLRRHRPRVEPGGPAVRPDGRDVQRRPTALRREGADFVVAVVHADRGRITSCSRRARRPRSSPATTTICSSISTAARPWWSRATTPITSPSSTLTIEVTERDGQRAGDWWPQFRIIDTATVDARPGGRRGGRRLRGGALARAGRADRHDGRRARQPQRHRAHARGGDRQPVRRRHPRYLRGRRRRSSMAAAFAPASSIRRERPSRGATSSPSCRSATGW